MDFYLGHSLKLENLVSLGKDKTLPESQEEVLAESCANGEICTLGKKSAWRMPFVPFNYLRSSRPGEVRVLVNLELNA